MKMLVIKKNKFLNFKIFIFPDQEFESKKFQEAVKKFQKLFKLNPCDKLVNCKFNLKFSNFYS